MIFVSHAVVAVLGVMILKISCIQSVHDIDVHDIYFNLVGGINTMEVNMCKFQCTSFAGFIYFFFLSFFSVRIAKLVNISVVDFVKILQFKYLLE